jgi:hypothetical protein
MLSSKKYFVLFNNIKCMSLHVCCSTLLSDFNKLCLFVILFANYYACKLHYRSRARGCFLQLLCPFVIGTANEGNRGYETVSIIHQPTIKITIFIHLQRMPQNRIPLKSYNYRPQGRRSIGRPEKRW